MSQKPTSVAIIVERNRRVAALIHYKRHKVETPGGKIDAGETPLQAAARELLEEAGLHATWLEALVTMPVGDHVCTIFAGGAAGQLVTSREGETFWCTKSRLIAEGTFGREMAIAMPLHDVVVARRRRTGR